MAGVTVAHRSDHPSWHNHVALDVTTGPYQAGPSKSAADNTAAIQSALDDISAFGGGVVLVPGIGTFKLATAGTNPYDGTNKYCLEVGSNTRLVLLPGAVLQLADGQQTDAGGAVDIIIGSAVTNVTITGKGKIVGNTAGQSGWSGGYAQTDSAAIHFYGGCTDIEISGITVGDYFSDAIWVGSSAGTVCKRVMVDKVYVYDVGEGILLENADYTTVDNCTVEDVSEVFAGDGIEWSDCEFFASSGCRLVGVGNGSGFDVFNSRYGTVERFVVDGWNAAVSIDDGPGTSTAVTIADAVAEGCPSASGSFVATGTGTSQITFQNCHARGGTGPGFQISGGMPGPVLLEGCTAKGNSQSGLFIGTVANLSVVGGQYSENTLDGVQWSGLGGASTAADTENLFITSVTASGNGRSGFLLEDNGGVTTKLPTGGITNNMLLGNSGINYNVQGVADSDLTVSGNITS